MYTLILRFLPYIAVFALALFSYWYISNLRSENKTLKANNLVLKQNIITQQSKCEEDIAIEKANVKIKEVIKYKTKYIKRVVEDEKLTNDKFMLNTNTVQ